MPISIQGNWTLTCIYKQGPALPQRFVISGATQGNGTYPGIEGTSVQVIGSNWQVNIQANDNYESTGPWYNSDMVKTSTQAVGNQYIFQINSEDFLQDGVIDLILQFSQPIPVQPPPAAPPPPIPVPEPTPTLPPAPIPEVPPVLPPPVELSPGKVYTLIPEEDKLPRQKIILTKGLWSEGSGSLNYFFTCSQNTTSASYQIQVYNKSCDSCGFEKQFSIAYGHDGGSGSQDLGGYDWLTPTNANYSQYKLLCLESGERRFKIGQKELTHFYAININQARLGDTFDPGNVELNIAHLSGSLFQTGGGNRNAHTGSNVKLAGNGQILRLIDDSKLNYSVDLSSDAFTSSYVHVSQSKTYAVNSNGEFYYMVSGSLEDGVKNKSNPDIYGILYPKMGIIILDGDRLDGVAGFLSVTGSDVAGNNAYKLFTAVSGAAGYTDASGDILGFQARKVEYKYSEFYFIRVKNFDYNFTNNPTYQTGSEGEIISDFQGNQQVYITQVGLYNPQKELIAVGKISMPLLKNYSTEALLSVNLTY